MFKLEIEDKNQPVNAFSFTPPVPPKLVFEAQCSLCYKIAEDSKVQDCCGNLICKRCYIHSFRRYSQCPFCASTKVDANILDVAAIRTCSVHEKICLHCDQKMSVQEFENHQKCIKDLASDYAKTVEMNDSLKAEVFMKTSELFSQKKLLKMEKSDHLKSKNSLQEKCTQIKVLEDAAAKKDAEIEELKKKVEENEVKHQDQLREKQEKVSSLEQQLSASNQKYRDLYATKAVPVPCGPSSYRTCRNLSQLNYVQGELDWAEDEIDRKENVIRHLHYRLRNED